ncbi:hypothetical protein GTCCBUS3UF5_32660 [Geobacillus thermoleovorans CCB_US3_UF5]|uniref:Uncharacterized protein n=3 Tax=Geobacillus TaxID=129337 RepID=A0A7U9JAI9_GEOTM|nr:hypothetical protein GTCCBUS3UF5_32660 [Geobacillus thermoleovorans CCB_US3_UF5]EQB96240.1 hypothetical protein GA8_07440 [Geobacillus sp. A8]ESU71913.1 hypothetical protein T260_10860 [Geobacillus sp. MAS1]GAD12830.1 hypothetical protein GBL_1047 [Geobacillus kaustophilus GBlys]
MREKENEVKTLKKRPARWGQAFSFPQKAGETQRIRSIRS